MNATLRNGIKKRQLAIYQRRLDLACVARESLVRKYGYLPDWDLTQDINERMEHEKGINQLYIEIDNLVRRRIKQLRNMSVDNF